MMDRLEELINKETRTIAETFELGMEVGLGLYNLERLTNEQITMEEFRKLRLKGKLDD